MYQFFVSPSQIDREGHRVVILGADVNHIKNVLRMNLGEEINVSDGVSSLEYRCRIESYTDSSVECALCFVKEANTELPVRIRLYQGLPKQDKMELIVQKAVELGAACVIPVACHRSVVKLDDKKAAKKVERWQSIAEAAAKQSKRGYIPQVEEVMSFKLAAQQAKNECRHLLIPYELAESGADGMQFTRDLIGQIKPGEDIAVFIGPEGGFEDSEIEYARECGIQPITLGKRILRTETAGLMVLSWLVLMLEGRSGSLS